MEVSFPRGGGGGGGGHHHKKDNKEDEEDDDAKKFQKHNKRPKDTDVSSNNNKKKRSLTNNTNDKDDVLFGGGGKSDHDETATTKKKRLKSQNNNDTAARQSLLPLGGGAVTAGRVRHNGTSASTSAAASADAMVIEALSWQKLNKGMRLLGYVREVHANVAIFSLPNLWTGYMLSSEAEEDMTRLLHVGQYLSAVITKATQESVADGQPPRRRLQVSCRPASVNAAQFAEEEELVTSTTSASATTTSSTLRGQVLSVQDHGLLVDLGFGRRGFLAFDDIKGNYSVDDDDDNDDVDNVEADEAMEEEEPKRSFTPGRILDFVLKQLPPTTTPATSSTTILKLALPLHREMAGIFTVLTRYTSLAALQPGALLKVKVQAVLRNGLAVAFGHGGIFQGSIELPQLGGVHAWNSTNSSTSTTTSASTSASWKTLFQKYIRGGALSARLLAVDARQKILRLTLQPHLLALQPQQQQSQSIGKTVGAVVENATVVRLDAGVGALLALPLRTKEPDDNDNDDNVIPATVPKLNADLWKHKEYRQAVHTQAVYVHISKATDNAAADSASANKKKKTAATTTTKTPEAAFGKNMAVGTQHSVRILTCCDKNVMDGIATGATAPSIVTAHVLTHSDVEAGRVYRQVPVCAHIKKSGTSGGILVDLGMGVRGLIPALHLFDSADTAAADRSSSLSYRDKVRQVLYAIGAKVDAVRVLSVDAAQKRCLLTAKKSLVRTKHAILSYDQVRVGQRATGFITRMDQQKGLWVTFFNGVYGRVTTKSLLVELGLTNFIEEGNYQVGDVVECRVVNIKKKLRTQKAGYRNDRDDDEEEEQADAMDDEQGLSSKRPRCYWELTLSLRVNSGDDNNDDAMEVDADADADTENRANANAVTISDSTSPSLSSTVLHIRAGGVLPLRSIRVIELGNGREKKNGGFVPGYAIVSVKSKYLLNENEVDDTKAPPFIDCKLPYDQILDDYSASDIESAASLDALAKELLVVGKKINRKGLVLTDPAKLLSEYTSGTGKLTVISVRPKLIELAEIQLEQQQRQAQQQGSGTSDSSSAAAVILPGPDTHLYVGASLLGYVVQLDPRHGAFIRFLNGLTGLIPKLQGGLDLKLFSTVSTRVVALDVTARPMKILLARSSKSLKKSITEEVNTSLEPGDTIQEVEVLAIDFHRATVKIWDKQAIRGKHRARLHCTMAESKPLDKPFSSTKGTPTTTTTTTTGQQITKSHPFFGLKVGSKLCNLRVAAKDVREGTVYLELTNRVSSADNGNESSKTTSSLFIENISHLSPGLKVSGIISSIDVKKGGLWLQVSPGVSGFVPGLELSEDAEMLNNLSRHFIVGSRLECVVVDKAEWLKTRSRFHHLRHGKDEKSGAEDVPLFSFLQRSNNSGSKISKPRRGEAVVGRINRSLPAMMAPALMLELRGGFIGRCCICELEEPDEWINMPIDHAESPTHDESESCSDAAGLDGLESHDARNTAEKHSTKPYPNGVFVNCRVLDTNPSKPSVVDISLRKSRLEGDLDYDETPEVGGLAHAYVVDTNKKGCFLRLSRKVEGRVILKELCDGFLPNPATSFPMGRLVVGKIKSIKDSKKKNCVQVVDVDMRESMLISAPDKLAFTDIQVGQKYKGTVSRIEDYGVFVRIQNSDVSGLVHKSECSDNYIKKLSDLYDPGDLVKVLVLKKADEKKQLGFSMKASHFENDEDSDDSLDSDSDAEEDNEMKANSYDDDLDSDDENLVGKLAMKINGVRANKADEGGDSESGNSSEDSESESDSDDDSSDNDANDEKKEKGGMDENGGTKRMTMDTDVGFDWGGISTSSLPSQPTNNDDDQSSDDESPQKMSHKSRRKQSQRLREEQEIARREIALADGTADANPETVADFERLLSASPDSSEIWIKYMAFHLSLADIQAARAVAERAFERISFRQEGERLNVWCALLTLELKYGSETGLQSTIDRACQHNNPKHVYLRVCEMLEREYSDSSPDSLKKVDEMYSKMCKKFKGKKKVWIAHAEYLLKNGRHEEAHALSKRALQSLPSYKHVETMTKVAQLVFEYGSPEKARTLFDGLLLKYPKRLDLFFVYVDKEVKHGVVQVARGLFERQVAPEGTAKLKLSEKQMKSFFKKWYSFEEQNGSTETQDRVKDAARAYVEQST